MISKNLQEQRKTGAHTKSETIAVCTRPEWD